MWSTRSPQSRIPMLPEVVFLQVSRCRATLIEDALSPKSDSIVFVCTVGSGSKLNIQLTTMSELCFQIF